MSQASHAGHDHTHNEAQDVTGTTTLHRREFAPTLLTRFRALKGAIRTTVGYDHDALRLKQGSPDRSPASLFRQAHARVAVQAVDDIEPARRFAFSTRAEAEDEFQDWLTTQLERGILERTPRGRIRAGDHYTAPYVRTAYTKGLGDATRRLRAADISVGETDVQALFNLGVHQDTIETVYTRTYDNLEGITDDTALAVRRELSTGLARGENPRTVASRLTGEVDDVGINRARTLSRTELSNSYNTAAATRYERMGVDQVRILVSDPCPICQRLKAGDPYSVDEAATLIPGNTHPNCVCSIAPVTP